MTDHSRLMASPINSTNSSLSSAHRFGLDDHDASKILIYNHPHGLITSSQQDLCKLLDNEPNLRCSKIEIPWGNSHVDVHQRDLFTEQERTRFADKPSMNLSLAWINLGRSNQIKRLLGMQRQLYIVSPETSPNTSPTQSQKVSPKTTFKTERAEQAGASSSHDASTVPL